MSSSIWFDCPFDLTQDYACALCGEPLRSGELVGEVGDGEFVHETCYQWQLEDQQEDQLQNSDNEGGDQ